MRGPRGIPLIPFAPQGGRPGPGSSPRPGPSPPGTGAPVQAELRGPVGAVDIQAVPAGAVQLQRIENRVPDGAGAVGVGPLLPVEEPGGAALAGLDGPVPRALELHRLRVGHEYLVAGGGLRGRFALGHRGGAGAEGERIPGGGIAKGLGGLPRESPRQGSPTRRQLRSATAGMTRTPTRNCPRVFPDPGRYIRLRAIGGGARQGSKNCGVAGDGGFEPPLPDPESGVLPLD